MKVPKEFSQRIESTFGADGRDWLDALPSILEEVSQTWSLRLNPPFENMAYNYVAPATRRDGMSVVVKVGVPNPELYSEIEALHLFNGKGAVGLIESDPDLGVMILEWLDPGEAIIHLDDEQATGEAAWVMRRLHGRTTENDVFPTVADWAEGLKQLRANFEGGTGPFPIYLVEKAEAISNELLNSMDRLILLHGDLHHLNILSAQRSSWLAIDPKGVIGEPAYETGAWIRNPFPDLLGWSNPRDVIVRRIDQFASELGIDRERIHGWSVYQSVLSAWWNYEDGVSDWENSLAVADLIAGSMGGH
jgi:streptomycin 6-kinase